MFLTEALKEDSFLNKSSEEMFMLEGCSPLLQVCLESEMSWNNIMQESYVEEFVAIKNEDVPAVVESNKKTSQKIKEWVKEKIEALKMAVKKMLNSLMMRATNVNKFIEKMSKTDMSATAKVQVHDWTGEVSFHNIEKECNDLCTKVKYMAISEQIKDKHNEELKDADKTIKEKFLRSDKSVVASMSSSKCLDDLKNFKSCLERILKETSKKSVEVLNDLGKVASNPDGSGKKISVKKMAVSTIDRITSVSSSLCYKWLADCLVVVREAAKDARKNANGEDPEPEL